MYPSCPPALLPLGVLLWAWHVALLPFSVLRTLLTTDRPYRQERKLVTCSDLTGIEKYLICQTHLLLLFYVTMSQLILWS